MTTCRREITKEQYDEIMRESNGKGFVPSTLETKYFSTDILRGYGLYGTIVYESDGKHILQYDIGDSCD